MIEISPSTALITGTFFYWAYYMTRYGRKPVLYHKEGTNWSQFLHKRVQSLKSVYWSLFWVPGGKFQTIFAALLPKSHNVHYRREIIDTPDGGQFTMAWTNEPTSHEPHKPIVFIYPGLVSTSKTTYVRTLTEEIVKRNFSVIVMVNRGLELPCLTGKAFCATHTTDLEQAVELVKQRHPKSPVIAIGISLGGLVLTRYMALTGVDSKLTAAFVYCCPFNPVEGSANIERWHHWLLYNVHLTKDLKTIYTKSKEKFAHIVDHDKVMNARSIREVDMHFTAKAFGYESVDHYYEDSVITKQHFDSIKTPTLCLCADDDAFVPDKAIPRDQISQTEYLALAVTSGGGHVGHLCGVNPYSTPYYIDMFVDFASAVFEHQEELPSQS